MGEINWFWRSKPQVLNSILPALALSGSRKTRATREIPPDTRGKYEIEPAILGVRNCYGIYFTVLKREPFRNQLCASNNAVLGYI